MNLCVRVMPGPEHQKQPTPTCSPQPCSAEPSGGKLAKPGFRCHANALVLWLSAVAAHLRGHDCNQSHHRTVFDHRKMSRLLGLVLRTNQTANPIAVGQTPARLKAPPAPPAAVLASPAACPRRVWLPTRLAARHRSCSAARGRSGACSARTRRWSRRSRHARAGGRV